MLESVKVALRRSVSVGSLSFEGLLGGRGQVELRGVEYLILLAEIVGLGGGFSD